MHYESHGIPFDCDVEIPVEEAEAYIQRGLENYTTYLTGIRAHVDGDEIELTYDHREFPKFDRIRRITGYLVGTLDRFNDAKRAEEHDRVKHGVVMPGTN